MSEELVLCDANKTALTARVTAAASLWMNERGMKPVETEVPIVTGWVADLAGAVCPTRTEAQELKLLPRKPSYRSISNEEWHTIHLAWEAAYKALPPIVTAIIEVKTTRSDFCGDKKWKLIQPAHLCYLATPPNLVKPEEIPPGWGWLVVAGEGSARQLQPASICQQPDSGTASLLYSIAVRRDHQTRHARLREFQRNQGATDATDKACRRLGLLIEVAMDVISGSRSLDESLSWHGGSTLKLKDYQRRQIETRVAEISAKFKPA